MCELKKKKYFFLKKNVINRNSLYLTILSYTVEKIMKLKKRSLNFQIILLGQ